MPQIVAEFFAEPLGFVGGGSPAAFELPVFDAVAIAPRLVRPLIAAVGAVDVVVADIAKNDADHFAGIVPDAVAIRPADRKSVV